MTAFCELQIPSSLKKEWILHQEDPHVVPAMDSSLDFADKKLTYRRLRPAYLYAFLRTISMKHRQLWLVVVCYIATKSNIKRPSKPPPSSPPRRSSRGAVMHIVKSPVNCPACE